MKVFSTSDFHFGHNSILEFRKNFKSIEEHDNLLFDQFAKLSKKDIVIIHGDFIFNNSLKYDYYIETMAKMSCRMKLIFGNHDSKKLYKENRIKNLELELPLYTYKGFWMSHCPIHSGQMRKRVANVHGHTHSYSLEDEKYFNVSLDVHNFKFVEFDEIREKYKTGETNDFI